MEHRAEDAERRREETNAEEERQVTHMFLQLGGKVKLLGENEDFKE